MKRSVFAILGLLVSACSGLGQNAHSPWHGFIYVEESRGVEARMYQGDFLTLTACMEMMQAKTIYSKFAYYCGFDCPDYANPNASLQCKKLMGSPLDALDMYKE